MQRIVTRGLAVALFALVVSPVLAQRQPGPGAGFGGQGIGTLVTNKSVQEELKLTEEQVTALKTAGEGVREKFKADLDKAREGKDREKMTELFKTMSEESNKVMTKAVAEHLKPEQAKRLKQIELQVAGTRALTREDVQKELKLSEKQVGEIKAIGEEAQKDVTDLFKDAGGDRTKMQEARTKIQAIQKESAEKAMGKLSAEQKTHWQEMTGAKFELKQGGGRPRPNL